MRAVPEGDAGFPENIRDRHHRRTNDTEGMFNTVKLQNLNKGLFRRHFHLSLSLFETSKRW